MKHQSAQTDQGSQNMPEPSQRQHTGYVILISAAAALGGFLFGFDSGVINGTVDALQAAFHSTAIGTGFSVSSMILGCALGAFIAGTLADKFGRKPVMIVAGVFFFVSAVGSGIATSSIEFVIYRVLGGFAVGAASVIAPAYIAEIAPAHIRGRLGSLQQMAIVLGLFAAFLSNYVIAQMAGSASQPLALGYQAWAWMFWVEAVPALLFTFTSMFIPESPRFLVAAGRTDHARRVLARTVGGDVDGLIGNIRRTVLSDRKPRLSDLRDRATGKLYPIVLIGAGLAMFQQVTGINVIMYYGATLWQAAGFSENHALLINVLGGMVNMIATVIAILLIDKIGRKRLLLGGSMVMSLADGAGWRIAARRRIWTVGAGCGQSVHFRLRHDLGAGHLGALGGNVSEPDSRLGHRLGRCRAVAGQFCCHHELSAAPGMGWPRRSLRVICLLRHRLDLLRGASRA
jgi:MFS transporter, SP family, sugar:H+ symporter